MRLISRIRVERARADRIMATADVIDARYQELSAKATRLEAALRELSYLVGMGNPAAVERQRGLIRNALGEG
jgi:endonuclease III